MATVLFVAGAGVALGGDGGASVSGAEEWEMAGVNRENAAFHLQSQADMRVDSAHLKIRNSDPDPVLRRAELIQAAKELVEAGGLYGATVGNLDRAADNWDKSGAGYNKLDQHERADTAKDRAVQSRANAVIACRLSAESYEGAAAIYEESLVNQGSQAAKANEKAAAWREKLATRR